MFWELEGGKVFETDILAASPTNADEVYIDVQKYYGARNTYGPCPVRILPFQ